MHNFVPFLGVVTDWALIGHIAVAQVENKKTSETTMFLQESGLGGGVGFSGDFLGTIVCFLVFFVFLGGDCYSVVLLCFGVCCCWCCCCCRCCLFVVVVVVDLLLLICCCWFVVVDLLLLLLICC